MKINTVLSFASGLVLAGVMALPAFAATGSSTYSSPSPTTSTTSTSKMRAHAATTHGVHRYYVSLKGKAHACEVVTYTPSRKLMVGTHAYRSHAAAAHAMAAAKICRI